jgi:hypothetical protein
LRLWGVLGGTREYFQSVKRSCALGRGSDTRGLGLRRSQPTTSTFRYIRQSLPVIHASILETDTPSQTKPHQVSGSGAVGTFAAARASVCVSAWPLRAHSRARRGLAVFTLRDGLTATLAVCVWRHRPVSRALAAGATWTSRSTGAPWAARAFHASVVDAAGAIYVVGGDGGGTTNFNDVWASTDGGA